MTSSTTEAANYVDKADAWDALAPSRERAAMKMRERAAQCARAIVMDVIMDCNIPQHRKGEVVAGHIMALPIEEGGE